MNNSIYTVSVTKDFVARHYLTGEVSEPERRLHSHHYVVEAIVEGERLNQQGYLVDIDELDAAFCSVIDLYGEKVLNDLPEFSGINPSLEHLARFMCNSLAGHIMSGDDGSLPTAIEIRCWENRFARAGFRRQLDENSPGHL